MTHQPQDTQTTQSNRETRQVVTKLVKVNPKNITIDGISKVNEIIDTVNVLVELVNKDINKFSGQSGQPNPPDSWDISIPVIRCSNCKNELDNIENEGLCYRCVEGKNRQSSNPPTEPIEQTDFEGEYYSTAPKKSKEQVISEATKIIEDGRKIRSQYPLKSIVRDLLEMVAETNPGFSQRCYELMEIIDSKEEHKK